MTENARPFRPRGAVWGLLAVAAAIATALVMALYANISARLAEARQTSFKVVELDEKTVDPAAWGKNFPRQFDSFQRTLELTSTKYGGAGFDPRPKSRLAEDPRLVTIFDA